MVLDQRMLLDDEAMEQALLSGQNDFVIEALAYAPRCRRI